MARQHGRQLQRRKEKANSSCWVNLIWFILFTVGASVLYEYVTGEELPWVGVHIGDAIDRLPDTGGLGDSIGGAIGGAVDKIPDFDIGGTINDLKDRLPKFNITGLIDRINIPDFGFDFDDIFTFDDGNIFGGGNATDGNGTAPVKMIGWNNNKVTKNDIFGSYDKKKVGLKLHIANALTNDWHYYFNKAVADWEHGEPDMLTIETSIVDVDPECTPEFDMMKVCNANYGKTGWKGINEMLIQGNYIVASVAKMNEYYVSETVRNSGSERQYTMCHEIGHGFGLPHLDENFYNADLNSCMDYSSRPQNNLQPSPADYASLNILYGVDANGRNAGNRNGWWRRRQRGRHRHLRSRDQNYVHDKNYVHNGVLVERRVYYLPA